MSELHFFGIATALVAAGAAAGRWRWAAAALAVWVVAVAVAAVAGVFAATGEDNTLGRLTFIALPGLVWVLAVALGVALRRLGPAAAPPSAGVRRRARRPTRGSGAARPRR